MGPLMHRVLRSLFALALLAPFGLALAQQHYWYDGQARRALWSDAADVADFGAPVTEKSAVLRPAALAGGASPSKSPVFRDRASGGGHRRALPGGVVVSVPAGLDEPARQALFARHALTAVRSLGPGSQTWLVQAPPGIASLELANRLYESGEFAAASPNWWQARVHK